MIMFITEHWDELLSIVTGVIAVAAIIVRLTPTEKDDEIVGKISNLLRILAIQKPVKKDDKSTK